MTLAADGCCSFFAERCGRFAFQAKGVAQQIELAHRTLRREGQSDATVRHLALNHHLGNERYAHAAGDHLSNGCELSASDRRFGSKTVGSQEVGDLHGQTMHFVQEQKFLGLEIVPLDLFLLCKPMLFRKQKQKRLAA